MPQNFAWIAFGAAWLLIAIFLCGLLIRLRRTLTVVELTLLRVEESLTQVVPEVTGSLSHVNAITGGVNTAVQTAGTGASAVTGAVDRARWSVAATLYGVRVGAHSLVSALAEADSTVPPVRVVTATTGDPAPEQGGVGDGGR